MQEKLKYTTLNISTFRLDGGAMYGIIPKPLWEKNSPPDSQNRIDLALRLVLLQSKNKNILIDTGIGDYHDPSFIDRFHIDQPNNPLKSTLLSVGLKPEDITDLIISHLHFDHAGGINTFDNNKKPIPSFPNATLHLHKKHFEYSLNPTARDAGSFLSHYFLPVIHEYEKNNKINWLTEDEGILIKECNLSYKCSYGHTPFLMHPFDDHFIYLADLIPTSNHVRIPWVMGYDIHPGQTVKDKEKFLKMILEKNLTIIYEHDPLYLGSKVTLDKKNNFIPNNLITENSKISLF